MKRLHPCAGIAIGPILFVLAMLGILASVFASGGSSSLGSAGITDRVTADVVGQANLIRSKISECQMQYLVNGTNFASAPCTNDSYPCSDQTDGTLVSALTCPNDPLTGGGAEQGLWSGLRPASLPATSQGLNGWMYMNAGDAGGRCLWTTPTGGNSSAAIVDGLTRAAAKFTTQEVSYDSGSVSQKFVVFITLPTTGPTDSHCTVP